MEQREERQCEMRIIEKRGEKGERRRNENKKSEDETGDERRWEENV